MKRFVLLLAVLALTGCGAAKAVRQSGELFDKYGCISRDFRGETPCEDDMAVQPVPNA